MADAVSARTFRFEIVSPERVVAKGEASLVTVPGAEGDFGVLAQHAPLVSSLRPGVVVVTAASGEEKKIFVSGGFADVEPELLSLLAEQAVDVAEIDRAETEKQLKALNDQLAAAGEDEVRRKALLHDIAVAQAKLAA